MKEITKLVLPVAGLGKRLQPLTLKTPKALVKANGKPLLDYVLEETRGTTIDEAILVINPKQKKDFLRYLASAKRKFPNLKFKIRNQKYPLGTGHVILMAGAFVGKEPFAVRFADDVLVSRNPVLPEILRNFRENKTSILTLRRVSRKLVHRFGVVKVEKFKKNKRLFRIKKIIEKPKTQEVPSNLVLIGAYVLTPDITKEADYINKKNKGNLKNDSQLLTDAFGLAIKKNKKILGWEFKGTYLDCGTLDAFREAEGYLRARRLGAV